MVVALLIWGEALEQGLSLSGVVTWLEAQGRFAWLANIADLTLPIPASAVGVASAGMVGYGLCRWLGRPLTQWLVGAGPLAQGEALFARGGGGVVALSRWVPILAEMMVCLDRIKIDRTHIAGSINLDPV